MTEFERNGLSLTEKQIDEQVKHPIIGVVTQVYEHAAEDDDTNFEVDVEIDGVRTEQRCTVFTPGSDVISVPKNGDKVLIIYREGSTKTPIAVGNGWSNTDRPPLGRAGMFRNQFESGTSPAGDGNLNITGYTSYNESVASTDKRELTPEEAFVQISKHAEGDNVNPSTADPVPAKIEMYDSSSNDQSWISVEINKEDGSDSDATWGIKFNIKTGEWKLVGPKGFGIESDGEGNFTWHHKTIDFNEISETIGPLSL